MAFLLKNDKAYFDYEILEELEAGLQLRGFEVKSLKAGRAKLAGARVIVRGNEAFLVGCQVQPYQPKNLPPDWEPGRTIKLLLTRREIDYLAGKERQRGLTIIPLSLYNQGKKLKLKIAVARGKKKYDKREKIKKREVERQIERTLKSEGRK